MVEKKRCFEEAEALDVVLRRWPDAVATIKGSNKYIGINGAVRMYQTRCGVIVAAEIIGLPDEQEACNNRVYGFHIHEKGQCSGTIDAPFRNVGAHYNPDSCEHPYHAGDLPPLFGNNGYALSVFLTNRFSVSEVIGRTIIIHGDADDLTTQPSGNAGSMIACGEIKRIEK